jgi:hypothetical protein
MFSGFEVRKLLGEIQSLKRQPQAIVNQCQEATKRAQAVFKGWPIRTGMRVYPLGLDACFVSGKRSSGVRRPGLPLDMSSFAVRKFLVTACSKHPRREVVTDMVDSVIVGIDGRLEAG